MKYTRHLTLIALVASVLLCSCGNKTLLDETRTFTNDTWMRFTPEHFDIQATNTDDCYNFSVTLTIDTDGTITPREAFEEAAAILVNQYKALAGSTTVESAPAPTADAAEDESGLMLPIEELGLSARTANALLNNDIHTVRDLVVLSESDLKELKGFGAKALDEVRQKLTELKV